MSQTTNGPVMPVFPSDEWIDEFCHELSADPRAGEAAKNLEGEYRFVVDAGGPLRARKTYDVRIAPDDDGANVVRLTEGSDAPRLTLTATYPRWRQLIRGELDLGLAIVLRRLKVSGDLAALRNNAYDAKPLVQALSTVETEWLD